MLQVIIEFPGVTSIKEKRRSLVSLKSKLMHKFKLSAAEVDLQQSLQFGQIGCAYVSNKQSLGESVLHKALDFLETAAPGRVHDFQIYSEIYT
ncbi:hypothetical protein Spiaf_1456 [Spirochaeta africana DSM 8902]|uniref:DUF503 domain-containing protein n=2 Tax=Spirochaeta TaxID=146 RepID=H9UJ26_SPIAZ|nr:hypothetical protein Spiaf_1456 [Spirochaeta africana DSM 8902]